MHKTKSAIGGAAVALLLAACGTAGAEPPNEIHLAFTADGGGDGMMTAENATAASDLAISMVVHEAGDGTPKLMCADLAP